MSTKFITFLWEYADTEGECIELKKNKLSIRISDEDLNMIQEYPGESLSQKVRSLLALHHAFVDAAEGSNLVEKYEVVLRDYLKNFQPRVYKEIESCRKELKEYENVLKEVQNLQCLVTELKDDIQKFQEKSRAYLEERVCNCVWGNKDSDRKK